MSELEAGLIAVGTVAAIGAATLLGVWFYRIRCHREYLKRRGRK